MVKIRYQLQRYDCDAAKGSLSFYWSPVKTKTFKNYKEALEFFSSYACACSFEIIEE